uniref:ATP synthase complex subunit 8 n=1 Tax=Enneapterygius etheostoma TaxID=3354692 RepID=A0A1V1FND8_9TELE|nr:ATPase subunit 8 [Enneapterygius etheostomus]
MPQLNPSPWFAILVFSWLVFLAIIPSKILAYKFPNDFSTPSTEKVKSHPWNWPWH